MTELIIIAIYLAAVLAIGLLSRRRARGNDDFFVAGRKSPAWLLTGSLLATIIGGSATVGMAGLGFRQGLTGAWWLLAGSIGLVCLGLFFAGKVRRLALFTLPELVEKQYGRRMALAASLLIVIAWTGVTAAQIIAAGKILGVLGMGSPVLWMVIFTAVFTGYTALGGQKAIIRTDALQTLIIFGGIFAGLALVLSRVGGLGGLAASLPPEKFAFPVSPGFGGLDLLAMMLVVGLTYVVGPDMYSRLFCARDEKAARRTAFAAAALLVPVAFAVVLLGMGAAALLPAISPEQALPAVIREVFSPLLGGLVLAALLCAMMSSADTVLLSAGTILSVDIIGRFRPQSDAVGRSRWIIVALGIAALVLALVLQGIISALLFAYTVYTAGVILPVLAGFFRDRLKVTPAGALAALIGGGAAGIAARLLAVKYMDLGAIVFSGLLLFLVSWLGIRHRRRR